MSTVPAVLAFMGIWVGMSIAAFLMAKVYEWRWERHVDEALAVIEDDPPPDGEGR